MHRNRRRVFFTPVPSIGRQRSKIIALAAIQGLYQQNQEQQKRIEELEALVKKLLEDKE